MRGKKSLINVLANLLEQIVIIIAGLILPRLILDKFGSQYNGLTSSITQFLACAVLLRAGIGGATKAALYKPLEEKKNKEVNAIINATRNFMKKVSIILLIIILSFSVLYPMLVKAEFSYLFTFSLFLIIAISTFAENFFGITYLILLQADQKLWITSMFKIISTILNVVIASTLILNNYSIHIVKIGSTVAFCMYPILLNLYVKKKYKLDKNVLPDKIAISQRWEAFWHQVATFITNNTDIMVLTIFLNMLEVSVYSVYNMILSSIRKLILSFSNGLEAAFGSMIAKNEKKLLMQNFSLIEYIVNSISIITYSCTSILIIDFVKIYTSGINDVNYVRPIFASILIFAQFLYCFRIPYQMIIQAAGHFKQTKKGAMFEAILNIILSIILVTKIGFIGVAIGTFVAIIIRTIELAYYASRKILDRTFKNFIFKIFISILNIIIIVSIVNSIKMVVPTNYFEWVIKAVISMIISIIIVLISTSICYRNEFKLVIYKLKNVFKHKNREEDIQ